MTLLEAFPRLISLEPIELDIDVDYMNFVFQGGAILETEHEERLR